MSETTPAGSLPLDKAGDRPRSIASLARQAVTWIAWYPLLLALTWELQFATGYDLDPVASYRALMMLAIGSLAITIVVRLLVRDVAIAGALATVIVLGLLKASTPLTALLFGLALALLLVEAWMEKRDRLRLPWRRIHEALTAIAIVLLAI